MARRVIRRSWLTRVLLPSLILLLVSCQNLKAPGGGTGSKPPGGGTDSTEASYILAPAYPSGASAFHVARGADVLTYFEVTAPSGVQVSAASLDELTLVATVIGSGPDRMQYVYRKDLSTVDQAAVVLIAGAGVPIGDQTVTLSTRWASARSSAVDITIRVTSCLSNC